MLSGRAPLAELLTHAASLHAFDTEGVVFDDAVVFQTVLETSVSGRLDALPAGLHPTNPPTLVIQAWQCWTSPWGPFSLVQTRVGCRSGLRPRGMVQGCVVDNAEAADALRSRWGFPARVGDVELDVRYHETRLRAAVDGQVAVVVDTLDPQPLGPDDVSYTTTVALAHTPRGVRLVQIDIDLAVTRAERLRIAEARVDAVAIGMHPSVEVTHHVSATVSRGALTLHELRYVSRPEELAFTGTERVDSIA